MLSAETLFPGKDRPKLLLMASNGGHLEQLSRIFPVGAIHEDSLWITFPSHQATSLMTGRRHLLIPEIRNRDYRGVLRGSRTMHRLLATERFECVVSTGAAIALSGFVAARRHRTPTFYIESVSRVDGPSLTGKIVSQTRLADRLATQYEHWSGGRWHYYGSVMDAFSSAHVEERQGHVFVTLGTLTKYQFPRLINHLRVLIGDREDVVWQLGSNPDPGLPGVVHQSVSADEFDRYASEAQCVISHAGVGSALRLMELGVFPILAIRRSDHGEHVDEHQGQIANLLARNDLCLAREADQIQPSDLDLAARTAVSVRES